MASLTEVQIRVALDTFGREGPEALRPLLHRDVVWSALDQPDYDCVGRDAVLDTLRHAAADGATWQVGSIRQVGAERFVVEVHVQREDGSTRGRRLTLSATNGLVVRLEGAPADADA
jgi:SnoaL-like domain